MDELFEGLLESLVESIGSKRTPEENAEIGAKLIELWGSTKKTLPETDPAYVKFQADLVRLAPTLDLSWKIHEFVVRSSSPIYVQLVRGMKWSEGIDQELVVAVILDTVM